VRNHAQNVLFKLQVNSRLKAINLSRRLGMI
jgi:DNA-binding CsgD family transcriptional regulator